MHDFWINTMVPILSSKVARSIYVLLATTLIVFIIKRVIRSRLTKKLISADEDRIARNKTILSVLSNTVTVLLYFFALLSILEILFNVQPSSIIAATGIVSVTVGFGAQSLVKDCITGFFILAENQYAVGEYITVGDFRGKVTQISLRATRLQSFDGDIMIIPNSAIDKVINHSRAERSVFVDITVSYNTDIEYASATISKTLEQFAQENENVTGEPKLLGVSQLGQSGINIKVSISCKSDTQYETERAFLKKAYTDLKQAGISIPYNHVQVVVEK